jgi:hypothetical protein
MSFKLLRCFPQSGAFSLSRRISSTDCLLNILPSSQATIGERSSSWDDAHSRHLQWFSASLSF